MTPKTKDLKKSNQIDKKLKTPSKKKEIKQSDVKRKSHTLLYFMLFVMIIGMAAGGLLSPAFNLSEIGVKNGINVNKEEIYNVIEVKYGENIFKQKYSAIKNNVLNLPYIKDVNIRFRLPDRFDIEYEERKPYALIKHLESYILVDKYGYLLEVVEENNMELPVIYGVEISDYVLGKMLEGVAKIKYGNSIVLLETARQRNFPYIIEEINYESISEVKVWVKNTDIDIIYGEIDENQITDKLNYLNEILKKLEGKAGKLDISSSNYVEKMIFSEKIE